MRYVIMSALLLCAVSARAEKFEFVLDTCVGNCNKGPAGGLGIARFEDAEDGVLLTYFNLATAGVGSLTFNMDPDHAEVPDTPGFGYEQVAGAPFTGSFATNNQLLVSAGRMDLGLSFENDIPPGGFTTVLIRSNEPGFNALWFKVPSHSPYVSKPVYMTASVGVFANWKSIAAIAPTQKLKLDLGESGPPGELKDGVLESLVAGESGVGRIIVDNPNPVIYYDEIPYLLTYEGQGRRVRLVRGRDGVERNARDIVFSLGPVPSGTWIIRAGQWEVHNAGTLTEWIAFSYELNNVPDRSGRVRSHRGRIVTQEQTDCRARDLGYGLTRCEPIPPPRPVRGSRR